MFACDCFGGAWYRFGVAVPAADTALPSAWVRLEDMPEKEEGKSSSILFTKAAPFGSPSKTSGSDEASTAAPNVKMAPLLQVAVGGVDDEMVWAIDSKHGLHCRKGVTTNLPIGTGWIRVSSRKFRLNCWAAFLIELYTDRIPLLLLPYLR